MTDFINYKNHFIFIRKLNAFLGKQDCRFICRKCFNSYTDQDVFKNVMQKCGEQNITSIKLKDGSHVYWKKHFHRNPFHCRINADFEADNEFDNSNI